jgi:hypothetical protein
MLRQGSTAFRNRRDDMYVRVHLLPRLCGEKAWRRLSKLWWKPHAAADPAGGKAQGKSSINPAHFQTEGLRPNWTDKLRQQDLGVREDRFGRGGLAEEAVITTDAPRTAADSLRRASWQSWAIERTRYHGTAARLLGR